LCKTPRVRRWLTLVICLCVLSSAGIASAGKSTPLNGTYDAVIKSPNAALNGTWMIDFVADGTYVVAKQPKTKAVLISGSSTVSGNRVTLVDKAGPLRCTGSSATGTYSWKLTGKKLKFTKVKDTCGGRPLVFASSTWTKVG
jgi:hypothetical protein